MPPLIMALLAAASFVVAVGGYSVMRSTRLEAVAASLASPDDVQERKPPVAQTQIRE